MITPRTDFPATGTMSAQDQHMLAALSSKRSLHCNGTQQRRQGPWSWVWVTRTRKTPHIMFYHIFWEPPILRMNTCAKRYVDIPQIPQCLLNSRQNKCFTQLSSFPSPYAQSSTPLWANSLARAGSASSSAIRWLCSSSLPGPSLLQRSGSRKAPSKARISLTSESLHCVIMFRC